MSNSFIAESPENYQQKCCVVLVLDASVSMKGNRINELNKGLQTFYDDITQDQTTADRLEISIVSFSDQIETLLDPSLVSSFSMPTIECRGTTKLVDGVREGINIVRSRKNWYKQTGQPYYRPWIILITDGDPDSDQDVNALSYEISDSVNKKDFFFFAIGVEDANMQVLHKISDSSMSPAMLQGVKFSEFFQWLSASMTTITNSKDGDKVNMPNPSSWMNGFSV